MVHTQRLTFETLNDVGCFNMLCAFLEYLSDDFQRAYKKYILEPKNQDARREYFKCRNYFISDYFNNLTSLNGREIAEKLEAIIEGEIIAANT